MTWSGKRVLEAQAGDAGHLVEGGGELLLALVAHALLEGLQDRLAGVVAHADDEREAEAGAVGLVQLGETRVLAGREPVEPGGRLLAGGRLAERAGDGRLAGEVGMGADERETALLGRVGDDGAQLLV